MSTQHRHGNSVALPLAGKPRLLVLAPRWFELADRADYLIRRVVTAHVIPTARSQPVSAGSATSFTAPLRHLREKWEAVFRPKMLGSKAAVSSLPR